MFDSSKLMWTRARPAGTCRCRKLDHVHADRACADSTHGSPSGNYGGRFWSPLKRKKPVHGTQTAAIRWPLFWASEETCG